MSPLAYDPKATVGGAAAALTMIGLAAGFLAGMAGPTWAVVAGVIGLVGAVVARLWKRAPRSAEPIGRLGIGLVVGAVLWFALTTLGVLPQAVLPRR